MLTCKLVGAEFKNFKVRQFDDARRNRTYTKSSQNSVIKVMVKLVHHLFNRGKKKNTDQWTCSMRDQAFPTLSIWQFPKEFCLKKDKWKQRHVRSGGLINHSIWQGYFTSMWFHENIEMLTEVNRSQLELDLCKIKSKQRHKRGGELGNFHHFNVIG
jgi:hypothetical protein